jgi:hypothetical protein
MQTINHAIKAPSGQPGQPAATAYHEAGHAVMAYLLDIPVKRATIVALADYLGHVRFGRGHSPRRASANGEAVPLEGGKLTPTQAHRLRLRIEIALAGGIAERHFWRQQGRRHPRLNGLGPDHQQTIEAACILANNDPTEAAYLIRWLDYRVRSALLRPPTWGLVEAVAHALLANQTLSAEAIAQAIATAAEARPSGENALKAPRVLIKGG